MSFQKLPARYAAIAQPLVISILMSCLVSGVSTVRTVGIDPDFLHLWMTSWGLSWVVAFPALLLVLPVARRLVFMVVEKPQSGNN